MTDGRKRIAPSMWFDTPEVDVVDDEAKRENRSRALQIQHIVKQWVKTRTTKEKKNV